MKSTIQTLAFLAALSTTASAAISLGIRTQLNSIGQITSTQNVAWISGEDPCSTKVYISDVGTDPCNIPIFLNNGFIYYEQNCGGDDYSLANIDGSFNSACVPFTDNDKHFDCGVSDGGGGVPHNVNDFIHQVYVCG